jgi:poly-gamma-glutamate capsule biosynthesis protein CapA/YwtB (metallophosphatase superfamily)
MIKIGFTGDFCPWQRIESALIEENNWKDLFKDVKSFFDQNDLNIIELESPLTTIGKKLVKTGPHLKADPQTVEIIDYLNCKLVATANNHFLDYGEEGLRNTYKALKDYNIDWMGSGFNLKEASRPIVKEIGNFSFCFINIAESEWTTTFGSEPGCNPIDLADLYNQISVLKSKVDFIIVNVHGGHEHYNLPSPRMKKWYRFFVDAGASAVIGHHTHIISGYEVYKNAPIFYGVGNFCFDYNKIQDKPWNYGMLVRLNFHSNKEITFELEFVEQNNNNIGVYFVKDKSPFLSNIQELNFIIQNDELLNMKFTEYASTWSSVINTWLQPYTGKVLPGLHKRGFLPSLIGKNKKLLFSNLIRCESHKDILLASIIKAS